MANPLDAYGKVLNTRGLGTPKTKLEAMIESGKLTDPLERFPVKKGTGIDDVQRYFMGLGNILKAGGRSRLPGGAFSPYVVPKNVEEATKQVTAASGFKPDLTGAKFDKDGNLIGKTPEDFVPFNTDIFDEANAEILKNLKPGEKPPTKSTMGLMGASDEALAQLGVAENEAQRAKTQKEAITSLAQLNQEVAEDEMGRKTPSEPVIEDAFSSAMQDYIEQARGAGPETRELSLDDYKKEFAEATGIDISGKVDKSSALMAFGLALMQNRAGKGFNVGRMLSSIGEAGEAALPALEKAKTQARNDMIAAGKYALETRSVDRAADAAAAEKLKQRTDYFIIPKGEGISGTIAGLEKGRLESLNLSELDALRKNENFSKQFDILPGSMWSSVFAEAMKTPEAKNLYLEKSKKIELIPGVEDDLLSIEIFQANPNTNKGGGAILADDGQTQYEALARMAADNQRAKEKFIELGILTSDERNIFTYGVDKLNSLASAFGVKIGEKETETDTILRILEKIAMQKAPEILGESGKTISDADRERVEKIVGQLRASGDIRTVRARIQDLFNDVILGTDRKIRGAIDVMDRYTGRNIGKALGSGELSEEEQEELQKGLAALGVQ